jgi:hypothetical protein
MFKCLNLKVKAKSSKPKDESKKQPQDLAILQKDRDINFPKEMMLRRASRLKIPLLSKSETSSLAIPEHPRLGSIHNDKLDFSGFKIRPFLSQDIAAIRAKGQNFDDKYFLKYIDSIVENPSSFLFVSLKSRLGSAADLKELNKLIKWERTLVCVCY